MITQIDIQNFQSHPDTSLKLVNGVNVIIGKSDSGKSVIIRALRWVFENKPGGTAFQSNWGGETRVTIHLDSGDVIQRVRHKTDNYYLLNKSRFDALGGKVPDEIQKALNLSQVNTQFQFDSPFLLASTSGEVANHFNTIAGITQIETSTRLLKKEISDTKHIIATSQTTKKELKKESKQYQHLDLFEADLEVLEQEINEKNNLNKAITKLNKILVDFQKLETDTKKHLPWMELLPLQEQISKKIGKVEELEEEGERLGKLTTRFSELNKRAEISVSLKDLAPALINVHNEMETLGNTRKTLVQLRSMVGEYSEHLKNEKRKAIQLKEWEREWHEKFPKKCPLCGK